MIILHRLGKEEKEFVINADLIETIEEMPDTVINLTTGKKFVVSESTEEVINKVVQYKRSIMGG